MKGFFLLCLSYRYRVKKVYKIEKGGRKMDQKEIRKCKIRRRSLFLRCRYDRRIISGLIAIAIVLAVCMGRMFRMTHISGVATVASGYGSVLLRNGADIYVLIGLAAFVAGVVVTVICMRFRKKKANNIYSE